MLCWTVLRLLSMKRLFNVKPNCLNYSKTFILVWFVLKHIRGEPDGVFWIINQANLNFRSETGSFSLQNFLLENWIPDSINLKWTKFWRNKTTSIMFNCWYYDNYTSLQNIFPKVLEISKTFFIFDKCATGFLFSLVSSGFCLYTWAWRPLFLSLCDRGITNTGRSQLKQVKSAGL